MNKYLKNLSDNFYLGTKILAKAGIGLGLVMEGYGALTNNPDLVSGGSTVFVLSSGYYLGTYAAENQAKSAHLILEERAIK